MSKPNLISPKLSPRLLILALLTVFAIAMPILIRSRLLFSSKAAVIKNPSMVTNT